MSAYMTGRVGDCGVGEELAEVAKQEIPNIVAQLEGLIESIPDEHGRHRPVSIFPNPRYGNDGHGNQALLTNKNKNFFTWPAYNSVAIHFCQIPKPELVNIMKKRAKEFASKKKIKIEEFRLLEQCTGYKEI